MSAIAGIFNIDGEPIDPIRLQRMTSVVAHRGPDGIGHSVLGTIGLGHLLHVTTLEARRERQPLQSDDEGTTLVWDGRLDNRSDVARRLGLSHEWAQLTDADLVLRAYRAWRQDAFQHLVGEFALAIWDKFRQELVCARDPIGVRPLHYFHDGRRFLFGTEIKQIFQYGEVPRQLDETMLGLALSSSWGDAAATFYKNVKRLPGGYWLSVSERGVRSEPFWNPDSADTIEFPRREDYVERFREILTGAVACRLRSTGKVGISLSGGVDSGAVASIAGFLRQEKLAGVNSIDAFSCVYDAAELDESPYVQAVADRYGLPVTWIPVDQLWAMKPPRRPIAQDEPFNLHFEAMQHSTLDSAKQNGTNVLLTGEGGDETSMFGYMLHSRDWFRGMHWLSIWRDLRSSSPAYRKAALAAIRHSVTPGWLRGRRGHYASGIPRWVREEFTRRSGLIDSLKSLEPRSRRENLYIQFRGRLPLFLGGDVRAASFGVEYRHPLWDSRVVEFLARIPPEIRFEGGREKPLLRRATEGILPEPVRLRSGHGAFRTLVDRGIREEETERIRDVLATSRLDSMGIIDAALLRDTFEQYAAGDDAKLARVMPTLLVEDWLRATEGVP